jgi:hypothetical protein
MGPKGKAKKRAAWRTIAECGNRFGRKNALASRFYGEGPVDFDSENMYTIQAGAFVLHRRIDSHLTARHAGEPGLGVFCHWGG